MASIKIHDIRDFVEQNIDHFHSKRLKSLEALKLSDILRRKNPYLFKAKHIMTADELIRTLLDAHLSSQEETIFGDFLESLAIFINGKAFGGIKSSAEGIDLEFNKDKTRFIVAIKSGPNWGNSSQVERLKDNFRKAKRILRTSNSSLHVVAVNGCCYGRDNNPDKGDYYKYCGQMFWEFISGSKNLYVDIIEPLGYQAKIKNEAFQQKYAQAVNIFSYKFMRHFCVAGKINWDALIEFNSSKDPPEKELIRSLRNNT